MVLGTLYGMGPETLARRIGRPLIEARDLLRLHQMTYRRFWDWSDSVVSSAVLTGGISTVFGWRLSVGADFNPRSLMNFPRVMSRQASFHRAYASKALIRAEAAGVRGADTL